MATAAAASLPSCCYLQLCSLRMVLIVYVYCIVACYYNLTKQSQAKPELAFFTYYHARSREPELRLQN